MTAALNKLIANGAKRGISFGAFKATRIARASTIKALKDRQVNRQLVKTGAIAVAGAVGGTALTIHQIKRGIKNIREDKHPIQQANRMLVGN